MAIAPELLALLVCPLDRARVELTPSGDGLRCAECHRVYPIRDDIPIMLVEEARLETAGERR